MMKTIAIACAALLCTAVSGACLEQQAPPDTRVQSLEGTWHVQAIQQSHACPELGSLPPVEPGLATFSRRRDDWQLVHAGGEATVQYREVEPGVLSRSLSTSLDGCDLQAESVWVTDAVVETRFTASTTALLTLSGDRCPYPTGSCTVRYAVSGQRR